jgi:hypothetical protein
MDSRGSVVMLGQISEVADAIGGVTQGRSDSFVFTIASLAVLCFVVWVWFQKTKRDEERMDKREDADQKRDQSNADSLRLISDSTAKTARATELMAGTVEKMEVRQERDRRAILSVIDSVDARNRGDEEKAKDSLRDARSILITGG